MNFQKLLATFAFLALASVLLAVGVSAQEQNYPVSGVVDQNRDYSLANATAQHPLKPPETSSPRQTLMSFMDTVKRSHSVLMAAYNKNLGEPGILTSPEVEELAQNSKALFERAILCLNLSDVPSARRLNVGYESALKLKEILDRIDLPSFDQIPDAETIAEELEEKKYPQFLRWQIPNTNIEIARVESGPRSGEFLFTPQTVKRLDQYYNKVKELPYTSSVFTTPDFLVFYESTPGRLLPPEWIRFLPSWSYAQYKDQTIWQWFALVALSVLTFAFIWLFFRVFMPATVADLSSANRHWRWVVFSLIAGGLISILFYLLDEQIRLTGTVLLVVRYIADTLLYFFISVAVFFIWTAIAETIVASPKINEKDIQASFFRALFGLFGFVTATAIFLSGLYRIGISLLPLLTGLGIGGLALALAVRPTLENIIGSFIIFIDKPFRVGERIKVLGHDGTVEEIGLRSTKIRLFPGHLTSIPNEKLASVEVENIGRRPYIRRSFDIAITCDTPPQKINRAIELMREILSLSAGFEEKGDIDEITKITTNGSDEQNVHPNAAINRPGYLPQVSFDEINPDSLNIMVVYWYHPPDHASYLEHATMINTQIVERFNDEGIELAFPTQTLHLPGFENRLGEQSGS